jgi:hypothetical protein
VVVPKGSQISQWGEMNTTRRDKKIKIFRLLTLNETTAIAIGHGRWDVGTLVIQFFDKSVLNAVRACEVRHPGK